MEAISDHFEVDTIACEGCGVCVYFCLKQPLTFPSRPVGNGISPIPVLAPWSMPDWALPKRIQVNW